MSSTSAADGPPTAPPTRSSAFAVLQRIGRGLVMPIAVLPAAALLLRLGQDDLLGKDGLAKYHGFHWLAHVAPVIGGAGGTLFDNLPVLFAVGVAIGFARRADGSTALSALVGYLVFDRVTHLMFAGSRIRDQVLIQVPDPDHPGRPADKLDLSAANPTYVIGGIVIGLTAALLWQRYSRIKLPSWLAFFGGRRFVPIATAVAALGLGVIFGWVWPVLGSGIDDFGTWLARNGTIGAGVYGALNRLLLPFGLHHIVNSIVWFTTPPCPAYHTVGDLHCYFAGQQGAGTFMAGFFPVIMFGLPAAALAIWRAAPPTRRGAVGGIMISAAFAAFLTGVTEPIEFAFIFVAPVLWVVNIALTGISMAVTAAVGAKLGFGFSAGAIDLLLNATKANTHKLWFILLLGVIYFVVYYVVFSSLITRLALPTPGREPDGEAGDATAVPPATAGASGPQTTPATGTPGG